MNRFWTEIETKNKTGKTLRKTEKSQEEGIQCWGKKRSELDVLKLQAIFWGF